MRLKMMATAAAALSLVATPVLAQVTPSTRSSTTAGASDDIPAGNAVLAALAVAAFAVGIYIAVDGGSDDEDMPTSP